MAEEAEKESQRSREEARRNYPQPAAALEKTCTPRCRWSVLCASSVAAVLTPPLQAPTLVYPKCLEALRHSCSRSQSTTHRFGTALPSGLSGSSLGGP